MRKSISMSNHRQVLLNREKKNEIPCRKEKKIDKSWLQLAITPD